MITGATHEDMWLRQSIVPSSFFPGGLYVIEAMY